MTDDTKLVLQLKSHDGKAIEKIIKIYTPYLSTVIYNIAGSSLSKEDSEEILSDTFISVWKNAHLIDSEKGSLRLYMAAITRNNTIKKLIQQKSYSSLDDTIIISNDDTDEKCMNDIIWDAVMSLGEPDNEIFVRYYKYGQKIRDISKSMDINASTIKTKLSRGKKKLKTILSDAEDML